MGMFDTVIVENVPEINLDEFVDKSFQTKDLEKLLLIFKIENGKFYERIAVLDRNLDVSEYTFVLLQITKNIVIYNVTKVGKELMHSETTHEELSEKYLKGFLLRIEEGTIVSIQTCDPYKNANYYS